MKKSPILAILTAFSATVPLGCGPSSNDVQYIDEAARFAPAPTSPVVEQAPTVSPVAEKTPELPASTLAELLERGATLDKSGKSLDLTAVEGLNGIDFAADAERWNAVKVVRGKGRLTAQTLRSFAKLSNLTEFLWSNAVLAAETDAAVAFGDFAKSPKLKKLRLTGWQTEDAKFPTAAFAALAQTPQLADVDVSGSPATAADLAAVDWKNGFSKLTKLNLYQTQVGDAGVDALLPLADRLTSLNLDDAQIGPKSAAKIARFTQLTFLHVGRSTLDDASIAEFAKLGKLAKIHVTRSKATEAGADALRAALPNCEVVSQPEN
ncbi:MAG: hypothetical protein IKY61_02800 [Thermoguttaceae bacterium]|nr:hypothetical protein [Thermoguttaceae bacterium]